MLSEKQIEITNKLLSNKVFTYRGPMFSSNWDQLSINDGAQIDFDYTIRLSGYKKMISVGEYWDYIKEYKPILLSSPSRSQTSRLGKRLWVRNNMPGTKLILAQAKDKQNYAQKDRILIDDRPSNIDQWRASGGIGILHISASDTIRQLKDLGL